MERRALAATFVGIVALVLAGGSALSKKPKPQPCTGGRFLLEGDPLVAGGDAATVEIVATGVSLDLGCPEIAGRVTGFKKGTRVRAQWPACTGVPGKVVLKARIDLSCSVMTGRITAKKARIRRKFRASRTAVAAAVHVIGRVVTDTGTPVEGAQVSTAAVAEATIGAVRAAHRAEMLARQSGPTPHRVPRTAASLRAPAESAIATGADGTFAFDLPPTILPIRVLAEVSWAPASLPAVRTARWDEATGAVLDMGDVAIPDVAGAEMTVAGGTAQTADGSISVGGLPAEVSRLFGRVYDPEAAAEAFPGEFAESAQIPLNSTAFLWMEALDASGGPVSQLSQAATIRSRIPRSQWADLEDVQSGTDRIEIPIYVYEENVNMWDQDADLGWIEDGSGTVLPEDAASVILDGSFSGDLYAAFAIGHLSWMNVDYAYIGPWTLSRIDRDKRNVDCLYDAMQLAKTIALSERGRTAYAKVNQAGADIARELADRAGPELKTFSPADAQLYGEYRGDSGGREDELFISTRLWTVCGDNATASQKKAATFVMALTILHESAHWKDDVKKSPDSDADTADEEGWQWERDVFGEDYFLNDDGTLRKGRADGTQVSDRDLDRLLDPAGYPAPAAGTAPRAAVPAAEEASPLELTIALPKTTFEQSEAIPVDVTYRNASSQAIQVYQRLFLEDYPIRFDIRVVATGERVRFLGSEPKRAISSSDFATLGAGETMRQTVDLVYDEAGDPTRYKLRRSGDYEVTAVYSGLFGLPGTSSNTLTLTVGPGGSISGTVTNATNGQSIAGATVRALQDDIVIDSVTSADGGGYAFPELPPGTYSLEARAAGFLRSTVGGVVVVATQNTAQNLSLSPLLAQGELRMVLTWGDSPSDLDSHLWLPGDKPYHVYYGRRGSVDACPFVNLDFDARSGYGPETVTIAQRILTGTYTYAVYNFSGSPDVTASGARVQVFDASGLRATFTVPASGTGQWWRVLRVDGATGAVSEVNEIVEDAAPYPDTTAGCDTP